jgi:phosphoribosylformimino-5-aminoimidazole carboxamide ribotide isomerase
MRIIPAIDLQSGRCVRLLRGDFERETVYGDDPVEVARHWRDAGASLLHVVDLDGARAGRPAQLDLIRRIAATIPIQMGGGLRTEADVQAAVEAGAQRVVVGTGALDLQFAGNLAERYGERLIVALDTRDGKVAVQGWVEQSEWTMLDLARALIDAGVRRFLHTDVERDGALTSPNFTSLHELLSLGVPVIASGGVASLEHIRQLRDLGAEAVIVGRALYERTIDLQEAVAIAG